MSPAPRASVTANSSSSLSSLLVAIILSRFQRCSVGLWSRGSVRARRFALACWLPSHRASGTPAAHAGFASCFVMLRLRRASVRANSQSSLSSRLLATHVARFGFATLGQLVAYVVEIYLAGDEQHRSEEHT